MNAQMMEFVKAQVQAEVAKVQKQNDIRLGIIEAGEHWHDIARRLLAAGDGPTAIAKATGQKVNTVKQFLKRNR
ncbi:hypothetical protein D3C78_1883150 [compost metagenome]